jgi:aldose 1-epimerase
MTTRATPSVQSESFGSTAAGQPVEIYKLTNSCGAECRIMGYGGTVVSLMVPDGDGTLTDVVLGYGSIAEYEQNRGYFGALVGRYANRIAHGRFTLDGQEYELATNNGPNHLHGGMIGFDKVIWSAGPRVESDRAVLELKYRSVDGEEGYPGNVSVHAVYSLTDDNELRIVYEATTDRRTIINLTNHSYFNLAGDGNGDILGHELMIEAGAFTPSDETLIPTGEVRSVAHTPFDFRTMRPIGEQIDAEYDQLQIGKGYDHNFVLDHWDGDLRPVARVFEPLSRRVMEVSTTQPGMQFYSGNYLGGQIGKTGQEYVKHSGFCLETQHFPDSPNKPQFPTVVLDPANIYQETTVYRFAHA